MPDYTLGIYNIKDPGSLIFKLKNQVDGPSTLLWTRLNALAAASTSKRLPAGTLQTYTGTGQPTADQVKAAVNSLSSYSGGSPAPDQVLAAVVALDALIYDQSLYVDPITKLPLTAQILALANQPALSDDDRRYMNRLIIEQIYPAEITRIPNKRMNYFDRQFLRAQDFRDEQDYQLYWRRLHNRLLHTPGVMEGLTVSLNSDNKTLTVSPGIAVDWVGREVVLPSPSAVDASALPDGSTNHLYVGYQETPTDESTAAGITAMTRILESPLLTFQPQPSGLELAVVVMDKGGVVKTLTASATKAGSAQGGDSGGAVTGSTFKGGISADSLKLTRSDVEDIQLPTLTCDGANSAHLLNSGLSIDRDLKVGGALTITGAGTSLTAGAASLGSLSVTGNVGIGVIAPAFPLTFPDGLGDKISLWGQSSDHFGFGIQPSLLQIYTDTAGADIAFGWGSSGAFTETARIKGNGNVSIGGALSVMGNVGVGVAAPAFPLTFPNVLGDKISLWGQSGSHFGFGIQPSLLQIYTDTAGCDIAFGWGSSGAFTETARIKGNGNVGIGNATPGARLDIRGGETPVGAPAFIVGALSGTQGQRSIAALWSTFTNVPADTAARRTADIVAGFDGGAWGTEYLALHVGNNGASNDTSTLTSEKLRIKGNGHVGIKTPLPNYTLDVNGRMCVRGADASAGIWFYSLTPNAPNSQTPLGERAFVGLVNDNAVGFWGNARQFWGLAMDVGTGNVSIGAGGASPSQKLLIDTGGGVQQSLWCEHRGSNFIVRPAGAGSPTSVIENTAGGGLLINPNGGTVGIGMTSPTGRLNLPYTGGGGNTILIGSINDSTGSAELQIAQPAGAALHWALQVTGNRRAIWGVNQNGAIQGSSRRLKENILPFDDALERLLLLQGVRFDWIEELGGGPDVGFVAEDVAPVMPELVVEGPDEERTPGLRYDRICVMTVEAIKEQQRQIAATRQENATLREHLAALVAQVARLEAQS